MNELLGRIRVIWEGLAARERIQATRILAPLHPQFNVKKIDREFINDESRIIVELVGHDFQFPTVVVVELTVVLTAFQWRVNTDRVQARLRPQCRLGVLGRTFHVAQRAGKNLQGGGKYQRKNNKGNQHLKQSETALLACTGGSISASLCHYRV